MLLFAVVFRLGQHDLMVLEPEALIPRDIAERTRARRGANLSISQLDTRRLYRIPGCTIGFPPEKFKSEMAKAGNKLAAQHDCLPRQQFLVFEVAGQPSR